MTLSSEDVQRIGEAYHRGDAVACPSCTSRLVVCERGYMGRVSIPLRLICPRHGIIGEYNPPDLRTRWPEEVVLQLLADHLRHGQARCPEDRAILSVFHDPGEGGEYLNLECPACGRAFGGVIDSEALERMLSGSSTSTMREAEPS